MRYAKHLNVLFLSCLFSSAFPDSLINHIANPKLTKEQEPWLTGPLLTPSSITVPQGHYNIEPYTVFSTITGVYTADWGKKSSSNAYAIIETIPIQAGITSYMDGQITPSISYRFANGKSATAFNDLSFLLGFQLFPKRTEVKAPSARVTIGAALPIGKYQKLDPNYYGIDSSGDGSWKPTITLILGSLYRFTETRFISTRLAISYQAQTPVSVKGVNVYGGTKTTKGTVYPGGVFLANLGGELSLSKKIVLAGDISYQYVNKSRFVGNPGTLGSMNNPPRQTFSFAPAVEYNFNANIGLIAGVWFSVAGKNSSSYQNTMLALNIFI